MAESKIPVLENDEYIIQHGRFEINAEELVKGIDVIPLLKKLYDDRDTTDIKVYHVLGKADRSDNEDDGIVHYCITFTFEGKRDHETHVAFYFMISDFFDGMLKRWKNEAGVSNVRSFKVELLGNFHNNWFFRDFATAIERTKEVP